MGLGSRHRETVAVAGKREPRDSKLSTLHTYASFHGLQAAATTFRVSGLGAEGRAGPAQHRYLRRATSPNWGATRPSNTLSSGTSRTSSAPASPQAPQIAPRAATPQTPRPEAHDPLLISQAAPVTWATVDPCVTPVLSTEAASLPPVATERSAYGPRERHRRRLRLCSHFLQIRRGVRATKPCSETTRRHGIPW